MNGLKLKWSNGNNYNGNFLDFDTTTGRLKYDSFQTLSENVYIYWTSNDGYIGKTNTFTVQNQCNFTLGFASTAPAQPLKFVYQKNSGVGSPIAHWTPDARTLFTNTHPQGCPFTTYDIYVTQGGSTTPKPVFNEIIENHSTTF